MPKFEVDYIRIIKKTDVVEADSEEEAVDIVAETYGDDWDSVTVGEVFDKEVTLKLEEDDND